MSFAETWKDLDPDSERSKSERKQILCTDACMWNLEKCYRWSYLHGRDRDTDTENKCIDTKGEREVVG